MPKRPTAPRQQSGCRSGALSAYPQGEPHAGVPRRLRPAYPNSFRSSSACPREGARIAVRALGETIVPCGGMAANALGLTTQVPVRSVYLTAGANRHLKLGELAVELRHAPRWQLTAPHRPAGDAVRALAWMGPEEVETNLEAIRPNLSAEDMRELAASRAVMPAWMAEPVSAMVADGTSQTT